MQKLAACLFLSFLFAVMLAGCGGGAGPEEVALGSPAPKLSLQSLDGQTVDSASLKGQPVVLNFWATWCAPCLKEIPELKEFAAAGGAKVVGVALDEEGAKAVKPFVEQHGINYTILLGNEETFTRFGGGGVPYTLLLDASQRVVKIYRGPVTREALERDLKASVKGD